MKATHILLVAVLLILSGGLVAFDNETLKPKAATGSPVMLQGSTGRLVGGAGRVPDDSAITAKAKWALANVPDLHDIDISVNTVGGRVILSGTVWSMADLRRVAVAIGGVEGIRQVENRITVKFLI